jgi:streptogramin lyase
MDSGNVYATGFGTTLRIINTSTSEVSSSPVLPFIPDAITGNSGVLYYTEAKGQRIGKLVLATGETPVIFAGDPAWVFRSVWAIGDSLYVTASDRIIRLDLRTGLTEHFAGAEPLERRDGVGPAARFRSTGGVWSDGRSLFIVDGGIRRLDLATSEVTTLGVSLQAPKGVWGRLGRRRLPLCDRLEPGPPNPNQ